MKCLCCKVETVRYAIIKDGILPLTDADVIPLCSKCCKGRDHWDGSEILETCEKIGKNNYVI